MLEFLVRKAFAADPSGVSIADYFSPAKSFPTIGVFINVLMRNILTIAGVVTLIGVIVTGWNYITHAGSGDTKSIEKDQAAFTGAVTGLIIIFGAYFIIQIVETLLGYKLLSPEVVLPK